MVEQRDYGILVRGGVAEARHWRDQPEAYRYVRDHITQYGELPSVESIVGATAVTQHPYEPVSESGETVETMIAKLRDRNIKLDIKAILTDWASQYATTTGAQLLHKMRDTTERMFTESVRFGRGGANWATSGAERYQEFVARKSMDYGKLLPVVLPEVTAAIGGAERGDVVTIMAFTGKGKSWLGLLGALEAHRAGYRVLVESAEMTKAKNEFRLDTLAGGFSNRGLWNGQLDARTEAEYRAFTAKYARDGGAPDLVILDSEDWPDGLTTSQLTGDIDRVQPDLVVVDQFNLLRFSGHNRDAKTALSRELKQIAARKKIVLVVLYQTNGDYEKGSSRDADGMRELKLPRLSDYSETIAVIQDSSILLGFDAVTWPDEQTGFRRGKAILGVLKSRDGGAEGQTFDLEWRPDDGSISVRKTTDDF